MTPRWICFKWRSTYNREKIAGIEQWSLKLEITRPYFISRLAVLCGAHDKCEPRCQETCDNITGVTDTFVTTMSPSQIPRHVTLVIDARSEKCASDSIGWSCAPCSMIVKKGEKNSMQKSIWVTVLQYIRLNRVSVAHQPGKWVILKSAMSGLNINVSHKSSWMLSS